MLTRMLSLSMASRGYARLPVRIAALPSLVEAMGNCSPPGGEA